MTLADYLEWFDEVVAPTERMMLMVPGDRLDWKLTEQSFSLGQLLAHISRSFWFNALVIRETTLPAKNMREILVGNRHQTAMSVEEAVRQLAEHTHAFKEAVKDLGEERFQRGTLDTPQHGRISAWRFGAFVLEHHIHHLMELHLCLKVLGLKVNTGTLYVALGKRPERDGPEEGNR